MLDLSEEFDEENIATCVKYFKRMAPMKIWLEMEIGITGGEEDGVDNTNVKADALYTKPEQVSRSNVFIYSSYMESSVQCKIVKSLYFQVDESYKNEQNQKFALA